MTYPQVRNVLLAVFCMAAFGACSMWDNLWITEEPTAEPAAVAPPVEKSAPQAAIDTEKPLEKVPPVARARVGKKPKVVSGVEISWQVPVETVQFYHLDYGYGPDRLDRHVRIKVSNLDKVDDPVHGPIFRYELKGIRTTGPLYYSLRAENGGKISAPTPVMKLE